MYLCCEISWTAGITSLSLRWLMCKLRRQEESPGGYFFVVSSFSFWVFVVIFWEHQYQRFYRETIGRISSLDGKVCFPVFCTRPLHLGLYSGNGFITTTIKFPVPTVNFWSGLHITSGVSLHLLKLMYFSQVRLASQQPVYLMQYFSLSVIYLDFWWLVS